MLFVLCVSLSSGEAGGGVLTFVLTLVLMFITTATITEQKPRSTLLQSWRKNRQASPLWEGAFEKQVAETVINSDLSSLNISRNAKQALHHVSREAASAKQTTSAQCKAPPCLCPRQSFNNWSTTAQPSLNAPALPHFPSFVHCLPTVCQSSSLDKDLASVYR